MPFQFHKAERRRSKIRVWLSGMSSSGKSYSALELAKGFGGKVAMIDTENSRGEMYGGKYEYDALQLEAPHTPERYIDAIRAAEQGGYNVLIIDSMSHEWTRLLEEKGRLDERGGNQYTNWNKPTARHNALLEAVIQSPIPYIIQTCRVKRDYVLTENEKGKMEPKLVGLANVQRDGAEYDLSIEFRIDALHYATALKDNTGLFLGREPVQLNPSHGEAIRLWRDEGKEAEPMKPTCQRCEREGKRTEAVDGDYQDSGFQRLCADCSKAWNDKKSSTNQ